jgi:UDP-N-acetylglucosamine diphosphorylase/glucosamine-1-phosphate N-acetyltransferase
MNVILFDDHYRTDLMPFTFTRPAAEIRIGIDTITEKWERQLNVKVSFLCADYLSDKYQSVFADENTYINGRFIPTNQLIAEINQLKQGEVFFFNDAVVAFKSNESIDFNQIQELEGNKLLKAEVISINHWSDIFRNNGVVLNQDFSDLTAHRKSQPIDSSNTILGDANLIFLEEGAQVEAAILNTKNGPIYIGKNAEVMEGSIVRGPFAMGECSTLKAGSKIYGSTTLGPHCKVGGEVNNSVIFGYSNKGHEGFLGNSVIGEWCNLGADTNNSNLKNNYGSVSCWNYSTDHFEDTGLQFCGLAMGDHTKSGINTMFNTGTVVGVCANVFGSGFPLKHIPSFSWGGSEGFETFRLEKAFEVGQRMMERRGINLDEIDQSILTAIFNQTAEYRD